MLLALVLAVAVQGRRISRLRRRLDGITRGAEGRNLEAILEAHLDKVFAVARELDELSARSAVLEADGFARDGSAPKEETDGAGERPGSGCARAPGGEGRAGASEETHEETTIRRCKEGGDGAVEKRLEPLVICFGWNLG